MERPLYISSAKRATPSGVHRKKRSPSPHAPKICSRASILRKSSSSSTSSSRSQRSRKRRNSSSSCSCTCNQLPRKRSNSSSTSFRTPLPRKKATSPSSSSSRTTLSTSKSTSSSSHSRTPLGILSPNEVVSPNNLRGKQPVSHKVSFADTIVYVRSPEPDTRPSSKHTRRCELDSNFKKRSKNQTINPVQSASNPKLSKHPDIVSSSLNASTGSVSQVAHARAHFQRLADSKNATSPPAPNNHRISAPRNMCNVTRQISVRSNNSSKVRDNEDSGQRELGVKRFIDKEKRTLHGQGQEKRKTTLAEHLKLMKETTSRIPTNVAELSKPNPPRGGVRFPKNAYPLDVDVIEGLTTHEFTKMMRFPEKTTRTTMGTDATGEGSVMPRVNDQMKNNGISNKKSATAYPNRPTPKIMHVPYEKQTLPTMTIPRPESKIPMSNVTPPPMGSLVSELSPPQKEPALKVSPTAKVQVAPVRTNLNMARKIESPPMTMEIPRSIIAQMKANRLKEGPLMSYQNPNDIARGQVFNPDRLDSVNPSVSEGVPRTARISHGTIMPRSKVGVGTGSNSAERRVAPLSNLDNTLPHHAPAYAEGPEHDRYQAAEIPAPLNPVPVSIERFVAKPTSKLFVNAGTIEDELKRARDWDRNLMKPPFSIPIPPGHPGFKVTSRQGAKRHAEETASNAKQAAMEAANFAKKGPKPNPGYSLPIHSPGYVAKTQQTADIHAKLLAKAAEKAAEVLAKYDSEEAMKIESKQNAMSAETTPRPTVQSSVLSEQKEFTPTSHTSLGTEVVKALDEIEASEIRSPKWKDREEPSTIDMMELSARTLSGCIAAHTIEELRKKRESGSRIDGISEDENLAPCEDTFQIPRNVNRLMKSGFKNAYNSMSRSESLPRTMKEMEKATRSSTESSSYGSSTSFSDSFASMSQIEVPQTIMVKCRWTGRWLTRKAEIRDGKLRINVSCARATNWLRLHQITRVDFSKLKDNIAYFQITTFKRTYVFAAHGVYQRSMWVRALRNVVKQHLDKIAYGIDEDDRALVCEAAKQQHGNDSNVDKQQQISTIPYCIQQN